MSLIRGLLSLLFVVIGAATSTIPTAGVQGLGVRIFFDGGSAFVQSLSIPQQMTVGAIASQSPADHYNTHRMRLMLDDGAVDKAFTTLPPVPLGPGLGFWDLHGWTVEICPGGLCPLANTLSLSPLKLSKDDCKDAADNIGLIPSFWALHPGVPIAADWRSKLESEVILRTGRLSGAAAANCVELTGPNGKLIRNVAVGPKEIKWELKAEENPNTFVDLVFTPKYGAGTVRRARLRSGSAGIELRVWTLVPASGYPTVPEGAVITHFQQFYSLFNERTLPLSERYKMVLWKLVGVSPGTECPPAMLVAP